MDKDIFYKFRNLEARLKQNEDFIQEISTYVSKMEQDFSESNKNLGVSLNTFFKEIETEIKDLREILNGHIRDYETDYEEVEARIDNLESIHGIATKQYKYGNPRPSQKEDNEVRDEKSSK